MSATLVKPRLSALNEAYERGRQASQLDDHESEIAQMASAIQTLAEALHRFEIRAVVIGLVIFAGTPNGVAMLKSISSLFAGL